MMGHRTRPSSPIYLYKPQGTQHDFCEESSQATATFRKPACVGEEMLSHNQLLETKDRDEVGLSSLHQMNQAERVLYKLVSRTLAPATLSQRFLARRAHSTRQSSQKTAKLANPQANTCQCPQAVLLTDTPGALERAEEVSPGWPISCANTPTPSV